MINKQIMLNNIQAHNHSCLSPHTHTHTHRHTQHSLLHKTENHCVNVMTIAYLLTAWKRVFLEKLTGFELVKKFPAFYGNQRFLTTLNYSPQTFPILSQDEPVHTSTSHFLKIHLNILSYIMTIAITKVTIFGRYM